METLYKDTIEVLRNTKTLDGGGTYSESEVISSTITGLIVPVSGNARFRLMQEQVTETTHRCYCGTSADIEDNDKLRSNSITYEIIYIAESLLGSNAHKEIELKRI